MVAEIYSNHSTEVRLWVDCGPHGRFELSRIGMQTMTLREPRPVPPGPAELIILIDGHEHRVPIELINGIAADQLRAEFLAADNVAPF